MRLALGLQGMRERAQFCGGGGDVQISASPGNGTPAGKWSVETPGHFFHISMDWPFHIDSAWLYWEHAVGRAWWKRDTTVQGAEWE